MTVSLKNPGLMTARHARIRLFGAIALWIVAYLALAAGYVGEPVKHQLEMAERRALTCLFGFALCLEAVEFRCVSL